MPDNNPPSTLPEDPQTLREVGLILRQLAKGAEDRKQVEAKHHEENKESIRTLNVKIDDLKDNYPTREEINTLKAAGDKIHDDYEDRLRRLERWGAILIGGLYVINAIIGYWIAFK